MRSIPVLLSILGATSGWASAPASEAREWTPEKMMQVKRVGDPRPAPDGKRLLFTVTEPVMTSEKSEYLTQIHLSEGVTSRPLTFGEKPSTQPRWSPDGSRIAFLSSRSGKNQIYLLRLDGGEAEPLTAVKGGIEQLAWSPDGTRIAFAMTDPKGEDDEKREKGKDDSTWLEEKPKNSRLWILPLAAGPQGKREPLPVDLPAGHVQAFVWSPDGLRLAVTLQKTSKADDWPSRRIVLVDALGRKAVGEPLAGGQGGSAAFSPDGRWLAFSRDEHGPRWASHKRYWLQPTAGGEARPLPLTPDGQPELVGWSGDSRRLVFSEAFRTRSALFTLDAQEGRITPLEFGGGLASAAAMDPSGRHLGFVLQSTGRAPEAHRASLEAFIPQVASAVNAGLPSLPLGPTEVIRWKGADGLEIEGLLTLPPDRDGKRVPLILNIHGGPAGVFTESFTANAAIYPIAAFAAKGIAVLRPNPRGSSGYGAPFRFANMADWGGKDLKDLLAGVDKVIDMGIADPGRLGVMGWSYGGFMTSWIITQTHRFKAASVGAAVTNLMSFNGVTDIPHFVPDYFGGQSWEKLDLYIQHSAMFQAKGVRTPTLIQHCEGDLRVPISQGYEFFNALKQQGVPVRMLVVPRQAHGPTEPKALLKVMQTNLDWFAERLR
ncbi:MAG: S9 family peptidase [Acidobacteria bacterium]|nr:S9 family peptidase [Acidobacteriota bacterium]